MVLDCASNSVRILPEPISVCQKLQSREVCGTSRLPFCGGDCKIVLQHQNLHQHGHERKRSCWSASFVVFIVFTFLFSLAVATPSSHQHERRHTSRAGSRHAGHSHQRNQKHPSTYLNQFAVNLKDKNENLARDLASRYGFIFKGQIGSLEGWYLYEDKRVFKRSLGAHHTPISSHNLENDPHVNIVEQQRVLKRVKRNRHSSCSLRDDGPNDPAWCNMWYMHCGGVNDTSCPTSMRISGAWRAGFSGEGVVVTILDDGIEKSHPDLQLNYDANASYDINANDNDPTPRYDTNNDNKHGTRCAGVVAAVSDNNICSVGIAYSASIGGIRMLDGEVTDGVEAQSLGYNNQHIDIYSASWGPDDDGNTVEGPGYLAKAAFKEGASKGRGGKGSIFVWASGNGGHNGDTCSCDGYINSIYTIGISSVSQNGKKPWYLESCASALATTYSSGEIDEGKIITTDLHGSCTYAHTGTSASAPMAAGVIALMLDANENLTWRDVQHIIVRTSNPFGLQANDWVVNGAGFNVSHVFGFGLMDAASLTHVSQNWNAVPEQKECSLPLDDTLETIFMNLPLIRHVDTRACHDEPNEVHYLEHVILRINITHASRGDLQIFLTSPANTKSNILERRTPDRSRGRFKEWDFMTTHHWGEDPQGLWRLEVIDHPYRQRSYDARSNIRNELLSWRLIFYGTRTDPQPNFNYNSCDAFPQNDCHAECNGCCGPTDVECRSCRHLQTVAGQCILRCPPHQLPDPVTKICQPCWRTCSECSAPYEWNCTACNVEFTLTDGRCVKQCAQGSYLDFVTQRCFECHGSCRTCEGRRDRCTSCKPGFEHEENECIASCRRGTYMVSYDAGCSFCHRHCSACTGGSANQCTACTDGMILHRRKCIQACPKRFYFDSERHSCRLCHGSCKTCNDSKFMDCLSCNTDYILRGGECRKVCRDGTRFCSWKTLVGLVLARWKRGVDCEAISCAECDWDSEEAVCSKCKSGRYLRNGICVQYTECGAGYFGSDASNECEQCPENCRSCSTYNDCRHCADGLFLYAGNCYAACPDTTYSSSDGSHCKACFFLCHACNGPGSNSCSSCRDNYFLNGQECVRECPKVGGFNENVVTRTCQYAVGRQNVTMTTSSSSVDIVKSTIPGYTIGLMIIGSLFVFTLCVGCYVHRFGCSIKLSSESQPYHSIPIDEHIRLHEFAK